MDFLQIVLDGWFNSINRDNLENYFLRSFKKAERDEFLDLKTFSDGCWEAIESLIKLIETKSINKRKQDLYYLLSSANIETVNYAKDELDFINNRGGDMEFSYPITYDGQSYQCKYGEMLQLKRTILKTFISELKKSENQKSESIPAPQPVEVETTIKEKLTAKHYVLTYVFDCNAIGESLPHGNKKELERIGNERLGAGKGNTFYKNYNTIIGKDLNAEQILIDEAGENWRKILLQLSKNPELLETYLQSKQL